MLFILWGWHLMSFTGELDSLRIRRPSTPGGNQQILFNQSGIEGGSPNLIFDYGNSNVSIISNVNVSGNLIVSANISVGNISITQNASHGNSTVTQNSTSGNLS